MDERHLLVTVSEQESALYGVQFVGHFFSIKEGLKITLFYTAPKPPALWEGERTHESVRDSERQSKEYERKGRKALDAAKKMLGTLGFVEEQIATKLVVRQQSKAMDIIREGERGLYDAVVLGRRGLSWLEQVFDESTSKDLLEKELTFPLWLCRRPDLGRKNILLCMDGSDAAYRMADHVGYMLAKDNDHEITLLRIDRSGKASQVSPEEILAKGKEKLTGNGYPAEMIKTKILKQSNVAKAILKEMDEGRYAAIAGGRTGAGQGLLKKVLVGSVSDALLHELDHGALWLCK